MTLLPLILGLILFLGGHALTMNRQARASLIARIGEGPYKGLYSLVSVIGLVLIVWGFGVYRASGMIPVWYPPAWTRHATFLLVLIAFVLIATTYPPSHIRAVVKHPMITSVIMWSLGHLLVRGDLGSILMFGGFFVWGVLARISMGRRAPADVQGPAAISREPRWGVDIGVTVIGIAVYLAVLFWLHPLLIGVSLMPG
ncbi:Uncharacterized membrane protein [Rhizobiales bacterium GAS191]|nr:Uncharacterized membrane protein [Rhizobiales bacterium GAS191]